MKLIQTAVLITGLTIGWNAVAAEKGAQRLAPRAVVSEIAQRQSAVMSLMHCPMCIPRSVALKDPSARGVFKTRTVFRNGCPSCEQRIVQVGHGKQIKNRIEWSCRDTCCISVPL